ncbi:MAG TPA: O-antigen ligase family protein [Bacteroidales bacterium]|jgi:O-antigen ligase|nr:O-antigen ligase family protein [Bacteroidales bacterium]HOS72991.1 O-antigen ligase family protein [Bacteroidales bacterium]HQH23408.1 O-antigen ligase family protein [Bacteroidales bacterium]HQJ81347.1 O-antigen ligase family protein [Bacteroidales bacterium]
MRNSLTFTRRNFQSEEKWIVCGIYTLSITLFLMPFPRSWSLYPLALTMCFGLVSWITDFDYYIKRFRSEILTLIPLILYFLIHALALIHDFNLNIVIERLMFILVPVLLFPLLISGQFTERIKTLLLFYITGIILIAIYQFLRASFESISIEEGFLTFQHRSSPDSSRFSWTNLSKFENPTYISIKAIWAFTLLLFAQSVLKIKKTWSFLLGAVLLSFIYLLAARAGFIILFLIIIYFIFYKIKRKFYRIAFVFLIPFIFFISFSIMRTNERLNYWSEHVINKISSDDVDWINIEPRTRSWYSTFNIIKRKPLFGVGLNSRQILAEEHRKQGFNVEADFQLNSHNQFLETQLAFGIPGSLILLWMLINPVAKRKRSWNPDLIIPFLIIVTLSMLFESILVRQWGIMFFVLFYCILLIPVNSSDQPGETAIQKNPS